MATTARLGIDITATDRTRAAMVGDEIMKSSTHTIHARFNPFAEHEPAISFQIEEGRTIAEIVAAAPGVPDHFWLAGEVRINGRRVERGQWSRIRPKLSQPERPIIITLHPVFHGGGGGSSTKNIVTTVAAIALIAGATLVSGGLLGPVAAGTIGTGLFGVAFLSGATGMPLSRCTGSDVEIIRKALGI